MVTQDTNPGLGFLHKAARRALSGTAALFPPHTRSPEVRDALARFGYGLDWLRGEHVVAYLNHGTGDDDFIGVILTNHALLGGLADDRVETPLTAIHAVEVSTGLLSSAIEIQRSADDDAPLRLTLVRDDAAVAKLLQEIQASGYAPLDRAAPLATLSDDDPTALRHLVETLKTPDPRIVALATLAHARAASGDLSHEASWDMTVRIQCLHRTLVFGRAMTDGAWLSPLRPADLAMLLPALYDSPTAQRIKGSSIEIDVNPPQKSARPKLSDLSREDLEDKIIDRVANTLIDRVARTFGSSLDELTDAGAEADSFRLTINPGPETRSLTEGAPPEENPLEWIGDRISSLANRFIGTPDRTLSGPLATLQLSALLPSGYQDLTTRQPRRVAQLLEQLLSLEARALAWRLLKGWTPEPATLLSQPDDALHQALTPHLTPAQCSALLNTHAPY